MSRKRAYTGGMVVKPTPARKPTHKVSVKKGKGRKASATPREAARPAVQAKPAGLTNFAPAGPAKPVTQPHAPPVLNAPWRLDYLEEMGEREKTGGGPGASSGSFLLDYWREPARDKEHHVVARTAEGLILLNRYPYANGHLLVALGEARPTLQDYDAQQRAALWGLTELAVDLMQRALEPQGINVGINQGRAAGAGVPQHLHVHLVPRWGGDVNFMAVVGSVRVNPGALEAMWERYVETWKAMKR